MTKPTDNSIFHIIKDPVHGSMQFTDEENNWIKPFIDSTNFQRLRHVKQLGLGDLIFPGAVHTRFNHAIGCCYIAGQIATKLALSKEERKVVMIAGLLHDIGHGPFSHAFEGIFHKNTIHHEDWTPLFLAEYLEPEFVDNFNKRNPNSPISKAEFVTIKNLIMHKEKKQKLLADIVSSQLDADRLDYLRRDSHFCGVKYGEYDFSWLLHCLAIVKDKKGNARLGITDKGIGVVEHYLMARRLMMRNVYHNGKKYAAEVLLTVFLKNLAYALGTENLFPEVREKNLAQFLLAVNEFNKQARKSEDVSKLKKDFLLKNYNLYKRLCDYDVFSMIRYFASLDKDHAIVTIAKRLYTRQLPKIVYVNKKQVTKARDLIRGLKKERKIDPWQISLVELPHLAYLTSQDPILVVDKMQHVRNIHDISLVLSELSDKSESSYLVFVDRAVLTLPSVKKVFEQLNRG